MSCVSACGLFPDLAGLTGNALDASLDVNPSDGHIDVSATDGSADAEAAPCPSGAGPAMVNIGPFCIDSTEVTASQYDAFLAADASLGILPPACSFKGSYTTTTLTGAVPINGVDWCDAYAYCQWAGKRLCGDTSGGASGFLAYTSTTNQWFYACSSQGALIYPYGNTYDGGACNDVDYGVGSPIPVASDGCEGAYAGVHDMAGNVWEWEDSCDGDAGSADHCRVRGGCWVDSAQTIACAFDSFDHFTTTRGGPTGFVGFRCCAP